MTTWTDLGMEPSHDAAAFRIRIAHRTVRHYRKRPAMAACVCQLTPFELVQVLLLGAALSWLSAIGCGGELTSCRIRLESILLAVGFAAAIGVLFDFYTV